MQGIENTISFYQTGFWICGGLALLFLSISVYLFFRFRIPEVYSLRRGKNTRKRIHKVEKRPVKAITHIQYEPEENITEPLDEGTAFLNEAIEEETGILEEMPTEGMEINFEISKSVMVINSDEIV